MSEQSSPAPASAGAQNSAGSTTVGKAQGFFAQPGVKFLAIGFISLLLIVPTFFVMDIVRERQQRGNVVANEIAQGWGAPQIINGPYIVIPRTREVVMETRTKTERDFLYVSPNQLAVDGTLAVSERKKSIYSTTLYGGEVNLQGRFNSGSLQQLSADGDGVLNLDAAFLLVQVGDNTGFRSAVTAKIGTRDMEMQPGTNGVFVRNTGRNSSVPLSRTGNGIFLPLDQTIVSAGFSFAMTLKLNGSRSITVAPAGRDTKISMKADWPHPGFRGAFLPDQRDISESGFAATWTVPFIARGTAANSFAKAIPNAVAAVSVDLVEPLKFYQIVQRTLKYAVLVIALIFLTVFILELMDRNAFHWIQYILTGIALVVFYVLLLALAERVGFDFAYFIAAIATTALISWYVGHALARRHATWIVAAAIAATYAVIYLVMREAEYALLVGAFVAFAAVALTMIATRNVDWAGENALQPTVGK
ncbi:MAG: cell envelope integrity protein CreD [Pseudomonadota bacterium]